MVSPYARLTVVLDTYGRNEASLFRDLAPSILRQRLVVEGTRARPISAAEISEYLVKLSHVCDMTVLIDPVTHRSDRFGWAGWVHWETSGAHFYAWEEPYVFFSVDIYTCKAFDAQQAVDFTRKFFDADEVVAKEF
jgi:S-adenosylmethionine/arginine decarboxylase-like enzyme